MRALPATAPQRVALFDLDNTLLTGDSDVLWCEFLLRQGVLTPDFAQRNAEMERAYAAGTVAVAEFAQFYASTLAGLHRDQAEPLRRSFLAQSVIPRIGEPARDLVRRHQEEGDWVVLTTATNRFITELTAEHLGVDLLMAIEVEELEGRFTGKTRGVLNMREGKVTRLRQWGEAQGWDLDHLAKTAYSDSINDLALLQWAQEAVVVNPDPRLLEVALGQGWRVLDIHRRGSA